ncbi:hypothetical protein F511_26494 [Dorcoceras hygrometricum]|uniref:Uncharacterized protein n=1 Tax=Dorcoceras hygrometricum TaxID=472368 RepID=A0A2Z7BP51_9LAMI|nr:hypothetical protein F511_26494 [Dorcoceras hygrometricum]
MASFTVNALQMNFKSVLSMDNAGTVRMFKSLEESGLRGFFGAYSSVFEGALIEFFANASVIAGTIVSTVANRKMVVMKDVFVEMFQIPIERMVSFSELLDKTVVEMKVWFSSTGVPFRPPNKKKDMKVEYRLLHDIVAKYLSAKAGSFDLVTTEKLEMMVAISAGLKVNWGHILFQTLVAMVYIPGKQSQGFCRATQYTVGEVGEGRPWEARERDDGEKKKEKVVVKQQIVVGSQAGPAKSKSETSSDEDTRPLAKLGAAQKGGATKKCELVLASSDSESTVSLPLLDIKKKQRMKRPKLVKPIQAVKEQAVSQELPIVVRTDPEQPAQQCTAYGSGMIFAPIKIREINWATHFLPKIDPAAKGKKILEAFSRPSPVEEHNILVIQAAWEAVSSKMSEYDEWARFSTETELVSELLKRRMLVQCKLYEMEMKKKVDERRANFDPAEPSANYDHMCTRFLDHELKDMNQEAPGSVTFSWSNPIVSNQGTTAPDQEDKEQPAKAAKQRILAIEHKAQEQPAQDKETAAHDEEEHQAQEEERQAQEEEQPAQEVERQAQASSFPSIPSNSSFPVHSSTFVGNNEDLQGPSFSGLQMVQYTEARNNIEEEEDFSQASPRPFDMVRYSQTYMKHDSNIFRQALFRKMGEAVTSVNAAHRCWKLILSGKLMNAISSLIIRLTKATSSLLVSWPWSRCSWLNW